MVQPVHREIHFWSPEVSEPPCGTLEDRFEWSDAVEDVTCEACLEALAGDGGDLREVRRQEDAPDDSYPVP